MSSPVMMAGIVFFTRKLRDGQRERMVTGSLNWEKRSRGRSSFQQSPIVYDAGYILSNQPESRKIRLR